MIKADFYGYPRPSKADWLEQVSQDLRGKDFNETLVKELWETLTIQPMYFLEDVETPAQMGFHKASEIPGMPPRIWTNLTEVKIEDEKEANAKILALLNAGVEGIVLSLSRKVNLQQVLAAVQTEYIQLFFRSEENFPAVLDSLRHYKKEDVFQFKALNGGILWSPSSEALKGGKAQLDFALAHQLLDEFGGEAGFRPLFIDFAHYADCGAHGLQELTFGLGECIELVDNLSELGQSPDSIFSNLGFHLAAGDDFFAEIAKLKAVRTLISGLAGSLGVEIPQEDVFFLVSNSVFTKSILDPYSDLIRQTYEGMAGILGGANALWIKVPSHQTANELMHRMARNVSTVLKEESFLDRVMDPAAGSFYLASLEERIMDQVREAVAQMEEEGGWLDAFQKGKIQEQVRRERTRSQEALLTKSKIKVGVNKYLSPTLQKNDLRLKPVTERELQLKPSRASYLVEKEFLGV